MKRDRRREELARRGDVTADRDEDVDDLAVSVASAVPTGCRGTRNVEYDLAASVEPLCRMSAETASVLDGPALVVEPLGPSQQLAIASV